MTSALAFLASSSSLALFACSFFWALINARLARGRISRTCLGGITNGSRGRSWNGCSFPENILSLRSLSWMIRIIYVEHQYHKKHIGYTSVTRKEAWFLKVTVSWNIPSVHNTASCEISDTCNSTKNKKWMDNIRYQIWFPTDPVNNTILFSTGCNIALIISEQLATTMQHTDFIIQEL